MTRPEKVICAVVFLLVWLVVSYELSIQFMRGNGDNAIAAELITNMRQTGRPDSHIAASALDHIFGARMSSKSDLEVTAMPLLRGDYQNFSFLRYHFIPLLYALVPFSWVAPVGVVLGAALSFSFLGLLGVFYCFLRARAISPLGAFGFCMLVSLHPVWGQSIFGQFFSDYLFLFLGAFMLIKVSDEKSRILTLTFSALVCALIVEKMAIISGAVLMAYGVLYWKKDGIKRSAFIILLGFVLLIFSGLVIKGYLHNEYYGSFLSKKSIIGFPSRFLNDLIFRNNVFIFLFYNAIPLLLLGFFEWRAALIAMIAMGPNLFGDIGGAEKTGFYTHYHSTYFPVLVWALAMGYAKIISVHGKLRKVSIIGVWLVFLVGLEPFGFWMRTATFVRSAFAGGTSFEREMQLTEKLDSVIPTGASVSAPESFMVHLYRNRKIYYYPQGIADVDYIVLSAVDGKANSRQYRGFYSYLGSAMTEKIDRVLNQKMMVSGFDLENPIMVTPTVAVLYRKPK